MRHELIASLTRQLSAVTSRRVSLALGLWGEPGIGKTHTVHAVFQHLPCAHLSLHATASAAQIAASLPRAKTLPAWAVAQLERMGRGETVEDRAVVQTLATALSGLAPFVLHVEDLHEATAERVALVESLARAVLRSRGVGLLVTSRAELPEPFRNHHLVGLSQAETTLLLEQELKARPPEDGTEWVFGRTRGNPLFTLEFVRYLRRQGFFWSDGEHWHWRKPPEDFVPVSIGALVTELVSGVSITPEAHAVLEARAIFSGELSATRSRGLWAQISGVNETKLEEIRASFERAGLLRGDDFAHPLFAEVIAGELEEDAKRALARRALEVLRETDPEGAAALIPLSGLRDDEALELLKRAVEQARGCGEEVRAARLIGSAARYATGQERVDLALEAEAGLVSSGDYPAREQLVRLALEVQPENRDAQWALAQVLAHVHRLEDVNALIAGLPEAEQLETRWVEVRFRALTVARRHREAITIWNHHAALWSLPKGRCVSYAVDNHCNLGEFQQAEQIIDHVLQRSDLESRTQGRIFGALAYIKSQQGHLKEAADLYDQVIDIAHLDGHKQNLGSFYYERAINQSQLERFEAAQLGVETGIRFYEQAGAVASAANARIFQGNLLLRQGKFERAEIVFQEAYETFLQFSLNPRRVACEYELALFYAEWGAPCGQTLAWKFARDALGHARAHENYDLTHLALAVSARVAAWRGALEQALEWANEAVNLLGDDTEQEDAYLCRTSLAYVLEANHLPAQALIRWGEALEIAESLRLSFESHEAKLEIARLQSDWESVRTLRAWFAERGLGLGVRRADACLETPPLEVPTIPTARINVLGSVTLERDGGPVPTRAKKRLEILAYLLETRIAGRSEASALELVDAFYAGTPEPEARNTLKQQIYLIRSSFGAESIVSTATGYALGAVSSDAEDFLRGGDSSLWRGAYLGSLCDGFHASVREALTLALHGKIEALLEVNPREAARLGAILLEMEPYDAEILRLTVQALERSGAAGAARRTFSEGRARLTEIGEAVPELASEFLSVRATA